MSGIYIHVPFCKKACHYCNFHFSTSLQFQNEVVACLLEEMELRSAGDDPYLGNEPIETIYFGGGTPSLLSDSELNKIITGLHRYFNIEAGAEITFEANPDDISVQKLQLWKAAGINRLSIGVQSFFNDHLIWMNRVHNANQSSSAIEAAMREGFGNISIDLIYGVPGMTNHQWINNLELARHLRVPHLSCYALTIEPSTALYKRIRQKKAMNTDEEQQREQFSILSEWAAGASFEHYEISNLAKRGSRSRHNSGYWQGKNYLGLGPSAHSFNGRSRQWNVSNNSRYIRSIKEHRLPFEIELLTEDQQLNEYIMTSVRTIEGIDFEYTETRFGPEAVAHIKELAKKFLSDGRVRAIDNTLQLTNEGKFFADGIAGALFR